MKFTVASYDKLTGLPDRAAYQNCLQKFLQSDSQGKKWFLLFFNIENFKLFNGTLGPDAGDQMLIFTGQAIQKAFPNSFVSRIGQDHYVVLTDALDHTERIQNVQQQIRSYHPNIVMSLNAGIYEIQPKDTNPIIILDRARLACNRCKGRYDIDYSYYTPDLAESLINNKYIIDHIYEAIENKYIKVYYQPLVRIQTRKLCGMEALARWDDPQYGLLPPGSFISILENAHLIHQLDLCIAEQVCRNLSHAMEQNETVVPVSINLSRLDFELCDVFEEINKLVKQYHLQPHMLDIEITESALSKAGDNLKSAVARFRENGYRIWLDDFGSDYSSLNTLKDFDFDVLKIDMAFLSGFSDSSRSERTKTIVRSVINMAKELGITTVCEGVESDAELSFLQSTGCEIAQGYLFSRPLPVEQFRTLPFPPENREDARFSAEIGRVNLQSDYPLGKENLDMDAGFQPMGLFEYNRAHTRTLLLNTAFQDFLTPLNVSGSKQLDEFLNSKNNRMAERIARSVEKSISDHSTERLDLVLNGDYCNFQIHSIATNFNDMTSVILVRAMNVSKASTYVSGGIKDKVLRSVYALFERVDVLDIDKDVVINVLERRGRFRGQFEDMKLQDAINLFCEKNIHPLDQNRFLDLYDMTSLPQKLQKMNHSFHSSLFRVHEGGNVYAWQLFIQSAVRLDGHQVVLSLMGDGEGTIDNMGRYIHETVKREQEDPYVSVVHENLTQTTIPGELLFEALIQSVPFGVFWKDTNRRFLGANRFFLNFYGFPSTSSIIGNTDEDMGWHVDPAPFMRDENDVLRGKSIYNAEGTCIVHGTDHRISASKFPVYRDGRVIGLIGMFLDKGVNIQNSEEEIDPLTGLLNSKGAIETFNRYQKSYLEKGIDFYIISIDINNFEAFNHRYGSQIADALLVRLSNILASTVGDDSVISRIGGDEFVILSQISDSAPFRNQEYEIASAVSTIHSIQGVACSVSVTTESMLYSESHSAAHVAFKEAKPYKHEN